MRLKTFGALIILALLMSVTVWAQEATTALSPLQLIDTDPLGEWTPGQPATLTFDRPLDCSAGTVQVETPAEVVVEAACSGNIVTINLTTPLQGGQTYRLILSGFKGADGSALTAPLMVDLLACLLYTSPSPRD